MSEDEKHYPDRAEILSVDDQQFDEVEVPEWGEDVYVRVRGLSGQERDAYEESMLKTNTQGRVETNMQHSRAKLVALCVIDQDGNRMFDAGDVEQLSKKSARAVSRIADKAQELSGITDEDMEELQGNLDETLFDTSSST